MVRKLPPIKYLKECFQYFPETGELYWRARPAAHFKNIGIQKSINARRAGTKALAHRMDTGYLVGNLDCIGCKASRVIWKLMTGKDPAKEVEHKNRKRDDNRWHNLRLATHAQNGRNRNIPENNTSGYVGVAFSQGEQKWKAYVQGKRKRIHLGTFSSKDAAIAARLAAAQKYYGNFAP